MISAFLYNIIIYPLVQILDLAYLFFFRIFDNHGFSIIGVSLAVSILTLPLYFEAEKWQKLERSVRDKLSDKTSKIKAVFHGDEQYMVLSAYYRQNNYHPIYSLRGSIGLLLQIPFFIAAYHYLSKLDTLLGTPFLGISNLGAPDSLLWNINILPIFMTLVNLASSAIYISSLNKSSSQGTQKEKIQFLGMALIFLLLLYNSPSGLVLYWTFNNIFSLIKNILQKTKYSRIIIFGTACFFALLLAIFVLFFHHGALYKRLIIALFCFFVFCFPLFVKFIKYIKEKTFKYLKLDNTAIIQTRTFVYSTLILFLLTGIFISSSLISSSVAEFSFIEQYTSPLPFVLYTAAQSFGFFLFWLFCIYFLLTGNRKYFLTAIITLIAVCSLINTFIFSGNYGVLDIELKFIGRNILWPSAAELAINTLVLLAVCGLTLFLLFYRRKQIIQSFQVIALIALFVSCTYNTVIIIKEFRTVRDQRNIDRSSFTVLSGSGLRESNVFTPIYNFSKEGKNILIIMLDRALPGFVPQIFIEKPELTEKFSGFVFYPNTISFGSHTIYGAPALFGGYEYSPLEINSRLNETLISKYNEAFLVLPKIFLDNNFSVTITDPPLYNETIQKLFAPYPEIKAVNILDKYTDAWLERHPGVQLISIGSLLKNRLIYFSFLKCSPLVFRHYIYDDGRWLASRHGNTPLKTIESYAMLDVLSEITSFTDEETNTFTMMINNLPHEQAFLQAPEYTIPDISSTNKGNGPFALDYNYHINIAALLLLGKWFAYLEENGVYDNTKIIIVSDHGINDYSAFEGNIVLPTGECLQFYTALLLFKDYNSRGELVTDNQFMVNADAPILAASGIISNPVNPFTGNKLEAKKDNGVTITSSQNFSKPQQKNRYDIAPTEWLYVHTNIFDPKNWKKTRID